MATAKVEKQRFARHYRDTVGRDATMHEVAEAWEKAGNKMPRAKTSIDILAKEFAKAARDELFYDDVLREPYNASICYPKQVGDKQLMFWVDTDKASRKKIVSNVALKRNNAVGNLTQATKTVMHWNRIHPKEEPVQMELDLGPDVQWNLNAPKVKKAKAS
jgi:hypothetical protein